MTRSPRLPFAEWRPSPNFGGYGVAHLPVATVTHSADSGLMDDPPDRFFDPNHEHPGSVNLWIKGDGHIIQMVDFDKSAWGNGALNRLGGPPAIKLVEEWYRTKTNPNTRTISIEIAGMGTSRGNRFTAVTPAQWKSWARIHEWLIAEQWFSYFGPENLLLHSLISATACPDGRFTVEDLVAHLSKGENMSQINDLIVAIYAGGELAGKPYEERLKYAQYRMQQAIDGKERSLRQQVENAQAHVHVIAWDGTTSPPKEV